jgi:hypothetical protein
VLLTADNLRELTGKEKPSAQARQLDHLGIPYRRRSDGTLVVLRVHVETPHHVQPREPRVRLP